MSEKPRVHPVGYDDTPFLPGGKWRVHDAKRPQPTIIDPGTASTQEAPGRPPSDAIVLFDGTDTSQWELRDGGPIGWKVEDGVMEVVPRTGSIVRASRALATSTCTSSGPRPPRSRATARAAATAASF